MDERYTKVILALADNNMNVSETSRSMFLHRNSLVYRIERIKKITGLDPLVFYDLVELVRMVKRRTADA